MKQRRKVNCPTEEQQIEQYDELEDNLQNAIDDLIFESNNEETSDLVSQHTSMIITHLAMAAASLRIKKQQSIQKIM